MYVLKIITFNFDKKKFIIYIKLLFFLTIIFKIQNNINDYFIKIVSNYLLNKEKKFNINKYRDIID